MLGIILRLLGAIGVFLFGMRIMSDAIQKVAGDRLQNVLNYMTTNRLAAVFTGFLITGIIQSSSATTVMVVSFANAGLLNLTQAIGVIMGANIGTTVTTWIVSFLGFKVEITAFALPIVGLGLPFLFSKYRRRRDYGEVIIGLGLLFIGLGFLKSNVPDINEEALFFLEKYSNLGFLTFLIFVAIGTVLTIILESSSAAMAITVTLAYKGYIGFGPAAAICLGENIGTTFKVFLVSIGTSVNARRTARSHFFFNFIGVVWMGFIFQYFCRFTLWIAPWDSALQANLPLNLALFHTIFNLTNTLLFLPFLTNFAGFIETLVKPTEVDKYRSYQLQYIHAGVQDAAQLNIMNARAEVSRMGEVVEKMFNLFLKLFMEPNRKNGELVEQVKELEELTDQMQEEISKYLVQCFQDELIGTNVKAVQIMLRVVHELENIGDSIYKLVVLANKKSYKSITFHPKADEELHNYSALIKKFIDMYKNHLNKKFDNHEMNNAYSLENEVNRLRNSLSKATRKRLQDGSNVRAELLYMDMVKSFENIGDNLLNIAQALRQLGEE
ncbi:MAG TPA: Na/Pi cotransporter [Candidatus Marinimicrobia bacterium]|nr:Na/Pi cotransporter [Candidatus Neomarinimicrobiota bacterium]